MNFIGTIIHVPHLSAKFEIMNDLFSRNISSQTSFSHKIRAAVYLCETQYLVTNKMIVSEKETSDSILLSIVVIV